MTRTLLNRWTVGVVSWLMVGAVWAASEPVRVPSPSSTDQSMSAWLERLHEASRRRAYIGTFVVSSGADIAASKIWHICDGQQQLERIETLTGAPRTTIRRNDEVVTFAPDQKMAWRERLETLRLFPDLLRHPGQQIDAYYSARAQGHERVAGFDALVVDFVPKDGWRYGYRVWSEAQTGLVVKLQTRDAQGQVLEQVAFTELTLDAPVKLATLARQMKDTAGYQVFNPTLRKTTPEAEGWRLNAEVPGFRAMSCHARQEAAADGSHMVQWVFSDGLASVSLFLETFDPQRHTKEKAMSAGATHSVSRRLDAHWATAMGEVPPETLVRFVQALERTR